MKKQEIVSILKSHLKIGGHDAWEGHYYYIEGIEAAASALLAASQSASVAQEAPMEIIDREYYEGVIAELKEALRLTRRALKEEMEHITDSLKATALPSTDPRCTCAAIVNPNIPHARSCPLSRPECK